jgi:hypothetical protein
MKKLILTILMSLALATAAYGECVQTMETRGEITVMQFAWTTTAVGSFTSTTSTYNGDGFLYMVETDPDGTAAPTDNYDITLTNANDVDVMGGALANRDTANTELTMPLLNANYVSIPVVGTLTLAITNAGNEKSGKVRAYFIK